MSTSDYQIISENDLEDEKLSGDWIRAYCPIHGGDHQRSLSIYKETGFGRCHNCGAQVLVREINPQAAENIERGQSRIAKGDIRVVDPKYIARAARRTKTQRSHTIDPWQQEEIALLRALQDSMNLHLAHARASAYIAGRGNSIDTAMELGVGYIPDKEYTGKYARLAPWADHIMFPVQSPNSGLQFVGRCLKFWEPGMDENKHHDLLKENNLNKYRKTHANGWFNWSSLDQAIHAVFVEGAFDALALLEAGISPVVAIIGTALDVDWLPRHLKRVTLAFDGDESGIEKSSKARDTIYEHGYDVTICHAPQDDLGKDWSERYCLHGKEGLAPLFAASPDTCTCGMSVNDDPGLGSYDEHGQYSCSKHCQEQLGEEQVDVSFSHSPNLRARLNQHVEMLQRQQQENYRQAWQRSGKVQKW